jgi:hypothetical protein
LGRLQVSVRGDAELLACEVKNDASAGKILEPSLVPLPELAVEIQVLALT